MPKILGIDAAKTFQHLMQEVKIQLTAQNGSPTWESHFNKKFAPFQGIPSIDHNKELSTHHLILYRDCADLLTYFASNRQHKELVNLYAPKIEDENRVASSAKRVGLQLPKTFSTAE